MNQQWIIVTAESRAVVVAERVAAQGPFGAILVGPAADVPGAVETVRVEAAGAPEFAAAQVADAVKSCGARVVITGSAPSERVLAAAAAHAMSAPVLTSPLSWEIGEDTVTATHSALGGITVETVQARAMALVLDVGAVVADAGQADLTQARRVVAVGRGLKAEADLPMIQDLANAVGAQVGCSRPISEGLGWLPKDRYIGVSGQHLAPELYVTAGISGQLQHMVGVREAGTIVAFEKNEKAPIVAEADYIVVGDMYATIPAVIEGLNA